MSRRCRVDGVIRTSVCGSAVICWRAGDAWLFERLFAAVLCRGELMLPSHELSTSVEGQSTDQRTIDIEAL